MHPVSVRGVCTLPCGYPPNQVSKGNLYAGKGKHTPQSGPHTDSVAHGAVGCTQAHSETEASRMPDIPGLMHCHKCGYWSGPTTAEDGQARRCSECGTSVRVIRYPLLHPNSTIGLNIVNVKLQGRSSLGGNWLYDLPPNVNPNRHRAVVARTRKKGGGYIYHCVAKKYHLREIRKVRQYGILYGDRAS
jgi:hypothetical protein